MPRRKDNTLNKSYGAQEGVDAAHRGSTGGATIRQHGFDAPARKPREEVKTVTVREAAGKVADWVNSKTKAAPAKASTRSKRRK